MDPTPTLVYLTQTPTSHTAPQQRWSLPTFQWKVAVMNFMNHAFLRPEEALGDQYGACVLLAMPCVTPCIHTYMTLTLLSLSSSSSSVPVLDALDRVSGHSVGALHNGLQGWQAKARNSNSLHKFAADSSGGKLYVDVDEMIHTQERVG